MKPQLKKVVAPERTNSFVADAIHYLDSPTNYRECLLSAPAKKARNSHLLLGEQNVPILERLVAGVLFRLAVHSRLATKVIRKIARLH